MMPNMNPPSSQEYNYESSGIDGFLSRSIEQVSWQTTLESTINYPGGGSLSGLPAPPPTTGINYDMSMQTGSSGGTQQIGNMTLDPTSNAMTLNDGTVQING